MTDSPHGGYAGGPAHRSVEIGVAVAMAVVALIVIAGSIQAGSGWGAEGPQAGFVPFYVGVLLLGASIVNLVQASRESARPRFAQWHQLGQVLLVLVPTAVYVALVPWIGIYVASALLIGFFMRRLGDYGWAMVGAIAVGMPLACFVIFERWFLVPLPKGPVETMLGY